MFVRVLLVTLLVTALAWSVLARGSEGAGAGQAHRVETGDTLWSIAVQYYGGDPRQGVWRLRQANEIPGGVIVPGQVLRVP
jgi:LysM repeat protein